MINFFKKYSFTIIFALILIILLPSTLGKPALTNTRAIITGMSIDKKDNEYSIALQLITPQSNISNNENLEIVDDTGETIFECFNNLSIKLGKVIGLEHTNILILSDSLKDEDIMNLFDFLYRNTKIAFSTILIQTDEDAQKLLETSAELNNNSSSSLQNNLGFSNRIIESSSVTTLGTFYNDYFSYSKISTLPFIQTPKESGGAGDSGNSGSSGSENGTQQGGSGGSGASSGGEGGSAIQPLVQNNGEIAVYKDGKLIDRLSKELSTGLGWLEKDAVVGMIKVNNVTDNKFFKNSTVVVKVEQSNTKTKSKIKDNKLILDVNINIYCLVSEIIDDFKSNKILYNSENYLTHTLKSKLKEKVIENINKSLNYCKENNLDIFKIYDIFYKHNNKKFKKFLSSLENPEKYLEFVEFNITPNIYAYK